jgi:hypothetical protein
MRRECPEAPRDDVLLPGLRCGVVHFKDARLLDTRDSIGAAIEASAQDHDLIHPAAERSTEDIIDVSRPDCHRASGPRPVPIDERPWHGGTDHRKRGAARTGSAIRETRVRAGPRRVVCLRSERTPWPGKGRPTRRFG